MTITYLVYTHLWQTTLTWRNYFPIDYKSFLKYIFIRGHSQATLTRFCHYCLTYSFGYCYKVKSLSIVDISSTTNLPRLFNVVKECPLREKGKKFDNFSTLVLQLMLRCTEYMNARLEYVTIAWGQKGPLLFYYVEEVMYNTYILY